VYIISLVIRVFYFTRNISLAITHTEYTKARLNGSAADEKAAKLAQKLGQLQPFVAVSLQECMGQLASFGPT
jgi:hypothetical protein